MRNKAISPVVATALLIVVSVVAAVGFQTWFSSFQSDVFTNVETKGGADIRKIETVTSDTLYFNNQGTDNLTIVTVKAGGVSCNVGNPNITSGLNSISLQNCTQNLTKAVHEVVVITNKGSYSAKVYFSGGISTSTLSSPVIDSFSSNMSVINYNQAINISWTVSGADYCSGFGNWSGNKNGAGSQLISGLVSNTSYTLNCNNTIGNTSSTIYVNVTPPGVSAISSFTSNSSLVGYNQSVNLTWVSINTDSCTASGSWSGVKAASGYEAVTGLTANSTFALNCSNPYNSIGGSVVVNVTSPPSPVITAFSSNVSVVNYSNYVRLNWTTINATSCTGITNWSGSKATSGVENVSSNGRYGTIVSFGLNCTNAYNVNTISYVNVTSSSVCANYCVQSFTSTGTSNFTVPNWTTVVRVLVVAGGGGAGREDGGGDGGFGGGGGGGMIDHPNLSVTPGVNYSVTVGAGGGACAQGQNSSFGSLVAIGGGAGWGPDSCASVNRNGGSGGGGVSVGDWGNATQPSQPGASGTYGYGNNGGGNPGGYGPSGYPRPGGGGAGAVGGDVPDSNTGGAGGAGKVSNITGSSVTYAGGGGGGSRSTGGAGGAGGGGAGASGGGAAGVAGMANTGGGAGGGVDTTGASSGGSGIVVVRYQ